MFNRYQYQYQVIVNIAIDIITATIDDTYILSILHHDQLKFIAHDVQSIKIQLITSPVERQLSWGPGD